MTQGQKQVRNEELVRLLSADFQTRWDAAYHWSRACSQVLALPGLRGFWPMSAIDSAGNAFDQSGNSRTLTNVGTFRYGYENLAPIGFPNLAAGRYLRRADEAGLDIIGNEAYVAGGQQGLTFGGWFKFDNLTTVEYIIAKATGGVQSSYYILVRGDLAGDPVRFWTKDGGAVFRRTPDIDISTGQWYFIVGRVTAGVDQTCFVNTLSTVAAAAPVTLFNSTADFTIGAASGGGSGMTGRCSLCFLCVAALPNATILSLYEHQKAIFNVR